MHEALKLFARSGHHLAGFNSPAKNGPFLISPALVNEPLAYPPPEFLNWARRKTILVANKEFSRWPIHSTETRGWLFQHVLGHPDRFRSRQGRPPASSLASWAPESGGCPVCDSRRRLLGRASKSGVVLLSFVLVGCFIHNFILAFFRHVQCGEQEIGCGHLVYGSWHSKWRRAPAKTYSSSWPPEIGAETSAERGLATALRIVNALTDPSEGPLADSIPGLAAV